MVKRCVAASPSRNRGGRGGAGWFRGFGAGFLRRNGSSRDFDIPDPGAAIAVLSLCLDVARRYRPGHRLNPQQLGEFNAVAALRIVGGHLA